MQVKTGVTYSTLSNPVADPTAACSDPSKAPAAQPDGTTLTEGITIKIKCKKKPHLLQFVNREIIKADGTHESRQITTSGGTYNTTTDPAHPNWNTDSASKPNPYYEGKGAHRTDDDGLTTFDQPGLDSPGPARLGARPSSHTRSVTARSYVKLRGCGRKTAARRRHIVSA